MEKSKELQEFADRLNALLDEQNIPPKGFGRQIALAEAVDKSLITY
jgi:hypothetical protein